MKRCIKTKYARYLIRGPYTARELRQLYRSFVTRYGDRLSLDAWLVQRGKVYFKVAA